jgi:ribonucleoside-diphosphate reductase beta chain|tara:strand:- start:1360 stop:1731 length:372 start_codon:yes stop_codon:yes gene_type:complete
MGCQLFRDMCSEFTTLKDDSKQSIEEAARLIVELESKFIDKMFEMGELENLSSSDLKEFIKARTNIKLVELGYESIFEYDKDAVERLDWFYQLSGGVTHTDFFAVRPTDYSKAGEGENWDDMF